MVHLSTSALNHIVGQETIPPATIGLAAEKTPLPCHRGGEPSGWGGGCRGPCSYIHLHVCVYTYIECVCANVYSMYVYAWMHLSMYLSPLWMWCTWGGWGLGGFGGKPPYHMGWVGGAVNTRHWTIYIYIYIYILHI